MIITQSRKNRRLLPAEEGTRMLAGRAYHWTRETRVNFLKATSVEVLRLASGPDPDEGGTCHHVVTAGGLGTQSCALDAPHPGKDHITPDGQKWPNLD